MNLAQNLLSNPRLVDEVKSVMKALIITHPLVVHNKRSVLSVEPDELAGQLATVVIQELARQLEEYRQLDSSIMASDLLMDPQIKEYMDSLITSTLEQALTPITG